MSQYSSLLPIFGIENPLLDISAEVSEEFLEKYGLKVNTACLAGPEHAALFTDLQTSYPVEYIAGGATQNSIRVAQWMLGALGKQGQTHFVGCVGKDEYAKTLKECAEKDGVQVHYLQDEKEATGTCACLIHQKDRCLVANLAAANCYKIEHLETEELQRVWKNAGIIYSSGYFLTVSPPSALLLAEYASQNGKKYMTNLSAPFICQFFKEPLLSVIPFADVIFGNESECKTFGESLQYNDISLPAIAAKIAALPKNGNSGRLVIITQGKDATIVVETGKEPVYVEVPRIAPEKILDTNGAGDAFVGGFLSFYATGHSVIDSVRAGHYASSQIIQVSGTKLHGVPQFEL